MNSVITSAKSKIYTSAYPYAEKVNPILHEWIMKAADTWDKGTRKTSGWSVKECYEHNPPKELKLITDYIHSLISALGKDYYTPSIGDQGWNNCKLVLHHLWGQYYNKGDFQESHFHVPFHWSFCYWVNTPRGSSPMIFTDNNKKVPAIAGTTAIFPSYLWHHIPPNKCIERSVIVGNFYYQLN